MECRANCFNARSVILDTDASPADESASAVTAVHIAASCAPCCAAAARCSSSQKRGAMTGPRPAPPPTGARCVALPTPSSVSAAAKQCAACSAVSLEGSSVSPLAAALSSTVSRPEASICRQKTGAGQTRAGASGAAGTTATMGAPGRYARWALQARQPRQARTLWQARPVSRRQVCRRGSGGRSRCAAELLYVNAACEQAAGSRQRTLPTATRAGTRTAEGCLAVQLCRCTPIMP